MSKKSNLNWILSSNEKSPKGSRESFLGFKLPGRTKSPSRPNSAQEIRASSPTIPPRKASAQSVNVVVAKEEPESLFDLNTKCAPRKS